MAPIEDPEHGIGKLAEELRRGRVRRGLTRPGLAGAIGRSVTTVQRAEAGHARPPWPVTNDIAAVCLMDIDEIERRWKAAGRGARLTEAPLLNLVRTPADLAASLRRIWEENGEPSSRLMEERAEIRAKEFAPLSRMSAWRIRERKQSTSSVRQLYAYLIACEVPEETFPTWAQAWHRAQRHEPQAPKHVPAPAPALPRRRVTPAEAEAVMMDADLLPLDPYPGPQTPWTAKCRKCRKISRVRYSRVRAGAACPVCRQDQAVA